MKQLALIICTLLTVVVYGQTELRCKGVTKSGKPCTSVIVNKKTGFCNAHNPNRPKCSAKNVKGEPCGMLPIKGTILCRMHTKKGE